MTVHIAVNAAGAGDDLASAYYIFGLCLFPL